MTNLEPEIAIIRSALNDLEIDYAKTYKFDQNLVFIWRIDASHYVVMTDASEVKMTLGALSDYIHDIKGQRVSTGVVIPNRYPCDPYPVPACNESKDEYKIYAMRYNGTAATRLNDRLVVLRTRTCDVLTRTTHNYYATLREAVDAAADLIYG